jgi:tetrapyrrole methylase family protein / MazG family protein
MSPGITLVGLGPGGSQFWTAQARQVFQEANEVYVRTEGHPSVGDIPAPIIHSFDGWYEREPHLAGVLEKLVAEVVRLGQREEGVIYAVPGHPHLGEATVPRIQARAQAAGLRVALIPASSGLEAVLVALNLEGSNLQIMDALEVASLYHPPLETGRPALIFNLHGQRLAGRLKQTLLNAYAKDSVITVINGAGTEAQTMMSYPLANLEAHSFADKLVYLYLPGSKPQASFSSFQNIIAHLRAPEGCPWDRKQTHQTLRPSLLEEAFEVLEALDANDPAALREELGDLLLHILMHAQIAVESDEFRMEEVIEQVNRKLVRRHPHVFSQSQVEGAEQVVTNWEAIKRQEKIEKGQATEASSALDGIPPALPALAQAMMISQKAVRVGFEWPNIEGVLDKIVEEAREITEATDLEHLESEIGDLLFSVVNLARWRQIDPETALRAMNARFTRRFKQIEALAAARGKSLSDMSLPEMDALWEEAKQQE